MSSEPFTPDLLRAIGPHYALGKMARGLIHEISNPAALLSLAGGHLEKQLLSSKKSSSPTDFESISSLLSNMRASISQIQAMIESFRMVTRATAPSSIIAVELHTLLASVAELCKANAPRGVVVKTEIQPLPSCSGRYLALAPAISLLFDNAFDALPVQQSDTTVTISARQEAQTLLITVKDNGVGMDKATVAQAFTVGFTTHNDAAHAGLGLPLAKGQIDTLNGTICIDSQSGKGTTITVRVPLDSPE